MISAPPADADRFQQPERGRDVAVEDGGGILGIPGHQRGQVHDDVGASDQPGQGVVVGQVPGDVFGLLRAGPAVEAADPVTRPRANWPTTWRPTLPSAPVTATVVRIALFTARPRAACRSARRARR